MIAFLRELAPARRRGRFGWRLAAWISCFALLFGPRAGAQTPCDNGDNDCSCPVYVAADPGNQGEFGMWAGSWDWSCFVNSTGNMNPEFSHAALIPTGPYRGKVLTWRNDDPDADPPLVTTAETWIFDPATPDRLHRVNAMLASNIFCSAMAWDATGVLLVAGGANPTTPPGETYRFFPEALVYPPFAFPGSCEPWVVGGKPWRQIGDMSLERYYPILVSGLTDDIDGGAFADIPGGSSFVVGGDPSASWDGPSGHFAGNDFWQALPRNLAGNAWSHTLYAESDSIGVPPGDTEIYERKPDGDPLIPEAQPRMDYYPRGFHLATTGIEEGETKNIFIANDVFPEDKQVGGHPQPPSNAAGHSWAMKPPYTSSQGGWELWTGPFGGPDPDRKERYWGGAVLLHTPDSEADTGGINRVLLFGGHYEGDPDDILWRRVEELRSTGPLEGPATHWETKDHCMLTGRYEHNTIVLPTGRVLLIGGACDLDANNRPIPAHCPELYDPGDPGEPAGAMSWKMARRPSAPGSTKPYARLYHNLGVLMPDGSVFNAGGIDYTPLDPTHANGAFSGEIFYPPYYTHPDRPAIVSVSATQVTFGSQGFTVEVHHSGGYDPERPIESFAILRPAAVTHHFDADQRYIELQWVSTGVDELTGIETFQVLPPSDEFAPPGWYMLFAVRRTADAAPRDLAPSLSGAFLRFHE